MDEIAPIKNISNISQWLEEIEDSIDKTTLALVKQIEEDRRRAEELYEDLLSLFNQGRNTPEDVRELNKAQENLQKTTAQLHKVLDTLAKIRIGETKIQIAQFQGDAPKAISRQELIDILEGASDDETE